MKQGTFLTGSLMWLTTEIRGHCSAIGVAFVPHHRQGVLLRLRIRGPVSRVRPIDSKWPLRRTFHWAVCLHSVFPQVDLFKGQQSNDAVISPCPIRQGVAMDTSSVI